MNTYLSMAANYIVKLIKKEKVAEGTMAFYFEKPNGFTFFAGQYINVRINNPVENDEEGNRRFFSIAAFPGDPYLRIATRMRDTAFKRTLKNAQLGFEVEIFGPSGKLILPDQESLNIFLTGGIGITPFYSMAKYAAYKKLPHKIYLFYSNKRPEDAVFVMELKNFEKINPNFHFIATMTEMEKSQKSWKGEVGYINIEMIKKYAPGYAKANFYIAGPPGMVETMQKMLKDNKISDEQIKMENFTGY